jgi:hypothetical protein
MKIFKDAIGNRTRDLPVYSAMPQPIAPPRRGMRYVSQLSGRLKDAHKF